MIQLYSTLRSSCWGAFQPCDSATQLSGIAREVIGMADADPTTRKIRDLCFLELSHIANHQVFKRDLASPSGSLLWALVEGMAQLCRADTQSVEGINSMVRVMSKRSPNISLELLASRLTIKRALGLHQGAAHSGTVLKFSNIKSSVESLVMELMDHKVTCLSILTDGQRWARPPPCGFAILDLDSTSIVSDTTHQANEKKHSHSSSVLEPSPSDACATTGEGSGAADSADMDMVVDVSGSGGRLDDVQKGQKGRTKSQSATSSLDRLSSILWAKTYNRGYKWRTGGAKKIGKTTGPIAVSHKGIGIGFLMFKPDGDHAPEYFIVADKFSHSVAFSRVSVETDPDGTQFLVWDARWGNRHTIASVESTILFKGYYDHCVVRKGTVEVQSSFLDPSASLELFSSNGRLPAQPVFDQLVTLFVMDSLGMKGVVVNQKRRPNISAHDGKSLDNKDPPKVASSGVEVEVEVGTELYLDDADSDRDENGSEESGAETLQDVPAADAADIFKCEMMTTGGGRAKKLRDSSSAKQPSSAEVSAEVARMVQDGLTAPNAELEEEALLLLVRRHNEENAGNSTFDGVGVGASTHPGPAATWTCSDSSLPASNRYYESSSSSSSSSS